MRSKLIALFLLSTSTAFALSTGEWFEIPGGTWEPGSNVQSAAKVAIHGRLSKYLGPKNSLYKWERYSFQFQGVTSGHDVRMIHVVGFCVDLMEMFQTAFHTEFDYAHVWVLPGGGGPCFFRADFDPAKNQVVTFQANASK